MIAFFILMLIAITIHVIIIYIAFEKNADTTEFVAALIAGDLIVMLVYLVIDTHMLNIYGTGIG